MRTAQEARFCGVYKQMDAGTLIEMLAIEAGTDAALRQGRQAFLHPVTPGVRKDLIMEALKAKGYQADYFPDGYQSHKNAGEIRIDWSE